MGRSSNKVMPIIGYSVLGVVGLSIVLLKVLKKKEKKHEPLEQAASMICQATQDAKQKIDAIVEQVRSTMADIEPLELKDLGKLAADAKEQFDNATAQVKQSLRHMKC